MGETVRYGIVEDDERILEVSGSLFDTCDQTGKEYALNDVELLVPIIPTTFYAGGLNYRIHNQRWANYSGAKLSERT